MKKNPMPELESALKQLRLSGMTETVYQRNKEAIDIPLANQFA